jgi:flagellar M-ring protein FliF
MATLFRPFLDLWQRLTLGQRAGLVLAVGLVIAIVAGAVTYTTRPVYTALYSGLNGKDASQIVDKLREQKVPFEVSSDGSTVRVPQDKIGELRLQMASLGLPRSGEMGYELFDKPMLGMTDFVQQMNYHRALEGELARTMSQLDAVETARVHLVVPSPHLFRDEQKPPTASIVIQLKPGATLTPQQVQGIAYLTAFSVEGLSVDNITIVDTHGALLSGRPGRNDLVGMSSTEREMQSEVEQNLERKALAMLENTLGPGRAQVKVTAKLNWNRLERTTENYDAEKTATLSEERQESSGGTGTGGNNGGTSERTITNYQVPKTIEKYVPEVGNVEKLSASVVVDGDYKTVKGKDGKEQRTFVDRSPQEVEKYRSLVAAAIGLDKKRGDELTVVCAPFAQEEPVVQTKPIWPQLLEKVLLGLALVGLFLLLRSLLQRMARHVPEMQPLEQPALAAGGVQPMMIPQGHAIPSTPQALAAQSAQAAEALRGAPPPATPSSYDAPKVIFKQNPQTIVVEEEPLNVEVAKHQELLRRTTDFIIQKPDNSTQILRSWLLDESPKHAR